MCIDATEGKTLGTLADSGQGPQTVSVAFYSHIPYIHTAVGHGGCGGAVSFTNVLDESVKNTNYIKVNSLSTHLLHTI